VTDNADSWLARHHFPLRRLHSLAGIVPVGVFLIEHLLTNSLAFWPAKFNEQVHWLHNLHYLIWLEILFIFVPLAFHGGYGIIIALQGKANALRYPYMDNWRYTLQRVTAWILVGFVVLHLLHFRFAHWIGGEMYPGAPDPFGLTQRGFAEWGLPTWLWLVVYVVGLTGAVFHFSNGIVTFCITWGITVSVQSRKRMSVIAAGVGAVLLIWGLMSLYGLQQVREWQPLAPEDATRIVQQHAAPTGSGS
jgi:succinate dehydrogenase / fumarate reductase cytochrome b subunit